MSTNTHGQPKSLTQNHLYETLDQNHRGPWDFPPIFPIKFADSIYLVFFPSPVALGSPPIL